MTCPPRDDLDRPTSRLVGRRSLSDPDLTAFGNSSEVFVYDVDSNMKGRLRQWLTYDQSSISSIGMDLRLDIQGRPAGTVVQTHLPGLPTLSRWFYEDWYASGPRHQVRYGDAMGAGDRITWSDTNLDPRGLPSSILIYDRYETQPPTLQTVGVQTRNVAGLVTERRTDVGTSMGYVKSTWTYDKIGRVLNQEVRKGPGTGTVVAKQTLTYYGADDPKTLTHVIANGSSKTFTYNYDLRHQLLNTTTNTSSYFAGTYAYGAAGRFASANVSQTGTAPPGTEVKTRNVNYVYGDTDPERVTALTNVSGGARYATFTYDDAGNMISKCMGATYTPSCTGENFTYLYDGKDQLRRATRKLGSSVTGSEEYWYDKDGQRIAVLKKNGSGAATELIWFLKDTEAHYSVSGSTVTPTFTYSQVGLGTPVARVTRNPDQSTTTELQFHGLANNTLATVATSGSVNSSLRYAPFGEILESADGIGSAVHRRRFNDKQHDELTGLVYYGARLYDKATYGWTQSDPKYRLAPDAAWTTPRRANLYAFCGQNPLRYIDPDGLSFVSDVATRTGGFAFEPVDTGPVGRVLEGGASLLAMRVPGVAAAVSSGGEAKQFVNDMLNPPATGPKIGPEILNVLTGSGGAPTGEAANSVAETIGSSRGDPVGAPKRERKSEHGSYTNTFASGKQYHGKGSRERSQVSARYQSHKQNDPHVATHWTKAGSEHEQRLQEQARIQAGGGVENPNNYNIRNDGAKEAAGDPQGFAAAQKRIQQVQ